MRAKEIIIQALGKFTQSDTIKHRTKRVTRSLFASPTIIFILAATLLAAFDSVQVTRAVFEFKPAPDSLRQSRLTTGMIAADATTTIITGQSINFSLNDQPIPLLANVVSNAGLVSSGTVTFAIKSGANVIGTTVIAPVFFGSSNVVYILPGGTPDGNYILEASYSGSGNLMPSTGTATLTVSVPASCAVPTLTAGAAITLQRGSVPFTATIATASDSQTPAGDLPVKVTSVPNGVTITELSNNNGVITAKTALACDAVVGANTVTLNVVNGCGAMKTADLTINITVNDPPTLGAYASVAVNEGDTTTLAPNNAPSDNGTITSITANASPAFTGTLSVNPATGVVSIGNAGPVGNYIVTVTATDNCGATSERTFSLTVNPLDVCTKPAAGLVAWYRAEGDANNAVGGSNGVLQSDVAFSAGKVGLAFDLDGVDDFVKVPASSSLDVGARNGLTIDLWINPDDLSTRMPLVEWNSGTGQAGQRAHLWQSVNCGVTCQNLPGALYANLGSMSGDAKVIQTGAGVIKQNEFQHIALTYDKASGLARLYHNGNIVSEANLGSFNPQTESDLYFGSQPGSSAPLFKGSIDEIDIHNHALSQSEIQAIFNAGSAGKCVDQINTTPTITAAAAFLRQQGGPSIASPIATVSDTETPSGNLTVTATTVPAGISINNIANNNGTITAVVAAGCNAAIGPNIIVLTVTEDGGLTATANLTVNVDANTPPVLGAYSANVSLSVGGGQTVSPLTPPTDNGSIMSIVVSSTPNFAGNVTVDPITGVVSISNAAPAGSYTIAVTATDNCGASTTVSFLVLVSKFKTRVILTATTGPYITGQPVTLTAVVEADPPNSSTPTGVVTFLDGTIELGKGTLDGSGRASIMTTLLNPGARGLTAVYAGDERFDSSTSAPLALSVLRAVSNVSAADYRGDLLAPDQIIAAFGVNLATATETAATLPLPTLLGGTVIRVRDNAGTEHLSSLFFVSPAQINYLMPAGMVQGSAAVTILAGDGATSLAFVQIGAVAPGIFSADASGSGLASALVLRVKANGAQSFEPVARFDPTQNKMVAIPIDFGPETDQLFMILYGTGMRYRSALSNVTAKIGGTDVEVLFLGAQPSLSGLDQVNLRLPRSLAGRGEVDIVMTVDGKNANVVKVNFRQ
jgi:uncharacterized protein (TIGR03437 family)